MKKKILAGLVASLLAAQASAEVRINGFANLNIGKASSGDTVFGYNDDVDLANESLFAIQLSADINEKMTATGQLLARGSDDYDVGFEWAYLTYAATDNLSVSAGRLRLPLFRYSASLDVGYSYHWVAPPNAVYAVPFNNIDGIRVDFTGYSGELDYNIQLTTGNVNAEANIAGQAAGIEINNVVSLSAELGYGNLKVRGVAARGRTSFDVPGVNREAVTGQPPALAILAQISPELSNLLDVNDDTGNFYGVGIEYDSFDWFFGGEYTLVKIEDSFYPDEVNYYVTAGIRQGKWTPFITYEVSDLNDGFKFLDRVAGLPSQVQGPATQLVAGVQLPLIAESQAYSVGVRYDWDTQIALKADVTRFDDELNDMGDGSLVRFAVHYLF